MAKIAIITPVILNTPELVNMTLNFTKSIHSRDHFIKLFLIHNDSGPLPRAAEFKQIMQSKSMDIKVIHNGTNRGVPYAYNEGLYRAQCKGFQTFILGNNDVLLAQQTIDQLYASFRKNDYLMLSAVDRRPELSPDQLQTISRFPADLQSSARGFKPASDYAFILFSKTTLNLIGYFDEQFSPAYFDDDDYSARLWIAGHDSAAFTGAPMIHLSGITNTSKPGRICTHKKFRLNRTKFVNKWGCEPFKSCKPAVQHYYPHPCNDTSRSLYIPYGHQ
ncbi:MAG: hypothetical protein U5R06_02360 [candidate division KSB1 bacterium]|nr:hypothetical protein [candidate division KSB1 bacterium]